MELPRWCYRLSMRLRSLADITLEELIEQLELH